MNHTIIHFEIPADDPKALADFYANLFGWKVQDAGGPGTEYWLLQTAPEGEGVGGAIMRRMAPEQTPINYIAVESVDDYVARATALGATLVVPKMAVPNMGYFAQLIDPQRNAFALFQTDPTAA